MPDTARPAIPQAAFDLYDAYAHGQLSRRDFMEGLSRITVAGLSVTALAGLLMPDYASAQQVSGDDARITAQSVTYASPNGAGEMGGYLVRPAGSESPRAGVLVIHENRGLNPYIADVARRVAVAGYVAFAPDALYPLGGWPGNDDDGRALQAQRDRNAMLEDFVAGADWLAAHPACNGTIGCVGFCFGGAMANLLAVRVAGLKASVPFYGGWPEAADAAKVNAALMVHLAGEDARVNAGWPAWQTALEAEGKTFEAYVYEGQQHGFHNDTTPRYNAQASALAWQRTLDFFARHLA